MHSKTNLLLLASLKKFETFFRKTNLFFKQKTQNFECFEKSYYFRRIIRQIHYI